jgi:hypothetical protein
MLVSTGTRRGVARTSDLSVGHDWQDTTLGNTNTSWKVVLEGADGIEGAHRKVDANHTTFRRKKTNFTVQRAGLRTV